MSALLCLSLLLGVLTAQSTYTTLDSINWAKSNASIPLPLTDSIHLYYDQYFIMFGGSGGASLIYLGSTQETPTPTMFVTRPSQNVTNAPTRFPSTSPTPSNQYEYTTKIVNWTTHSLQTNAAQSWSVGSVRCWSQCHSGVSDGTYFFVKGSQPNCGQDYFLYQFHPWHLIYQDRVWFQRHNLTKFYFNHTHNTLTNCGYNFPSSHGCVATNPRNFHETKTVYIVLGNRIFAYNVSSDNGYFSEPFTAVEWVCIKMDNNTDECETQTIPHTLDRCACSFDVTDQFIWITDDHAHLWRYDVDPARNEIIDAAAYAVDLTTGRPNINHTLNNIYGTPFYYYTHDTWRPRMIELSHGFIMVTGNGRDFIFLPNVSIANPFYYPSTKTKYIDVVCAGRHHYAAYDWIGGNTPIFLSWPSFNVLSLGGYTFSNVHYEEILCEKHPEEHQCSNEEYSYSKALYNQTLTAQIRTYSWLQDYHLIVNFTEKILFGDSIYFNIYFEPTCNLFHYAEYLQPWMATRFNPFVFEIQVQANDENIGIETSYMYVDWITTYSQCYLCLNRQPLNSSFMQMNWENEEPSLPDECILCSDGLSTGDIEEDQAGVTYQLTFEILNAPQYGMFTLESSVRAFTIAECDPGYGTTIGAQSLDCNKCPFNQFTFQQSLDPCVECNGVSEGLLCSGGNGTHVTYNFFTTLSITRMYQNKMMQLLRSFVHQSIVARECLAVTIFPNILTDQRRIMTRKRQDILLSISMTMSMITTIHSIGTLILQIMDYCVHLDGMWMYHFVVHVWMVTQNY
eukprot:18829_1